MSDTPTENADVSELAQQVVAELESGRYGDKFVLSRRQLIALAGSGLSVAALMSFGVSEAQAQEAVGAVGTESEPIDVYGDTVQANSAEIAGTATAEALEADRAIVSEVVGVMQWESGGDDQTVPNETFTKVDWQIVSESDDVVSVSTDDNEIEIHESGTYSINSWVIWVDDSGWTTGDRSELRVFINGSQIHQSRQLKVGEEVQGVRTQPSVRRLSAGDVIDVRVFQDSGSDQQLFTGSGSADEFAQFEVIRHG